MKSVIINASEMVPMPFEIAVVILSARKVKLGPTFNLIRFRNLFLTVAGIDFNHLKSFFGITIGLVIKDNIGNRHDFLLLQSIHSIEIIFPAAILGPDSSILIKFTQIIKIINAIANIIGTRSFKSRWHPNFANPNILKMTGIFS